MARNAKLDLAKRQAVGIYRKASPHAFINKGVAVHSGGDYRRVEGSKPCYQNRPSHPDTIEGVKVTVCEPQTYRGDFRKRGMATPQSRSHMNTFAFMKRSRIAEPKWVPAGTQVLIPRRIIAWQGCACGK